MSDELRRNIENFLMDSTTNQLAVFSGVQSGHINRYKQGDIKKPNRNILLKICLALELSINEINKVFKEYGQESLESSDIAYFKEALIDRDIPPGMHPLKPDRLVFEIGIMSIEKKPGTVKLVTGYPHAVFQSEKDIRNKNVIYESITKELLRLRKDNFNKSIRSNEIHHFICDKCIRQYVGERKKESGIVDVFNTMLTTATNIKNKYNLYIIDACSYFHFHIKEPNRKLIKNDKPIVCFSGQVARHRREHERRRITRPLFGFLSTDSGMYKHFSDEFDRLSKYVIIKNNDMKGLEKYISELLENEGLAN